MVTCYVIYDIWQIDMCNCWSTQKLDMFSRLLNTHYNNPVYAFIMMWQTTNEYMKMFVYSMDEQFEK